MVPTSTLNDWMKKETEYLNISQDKLTNTTLHKSRDLKYPKVEQELINYIKFNRKLFNALTIWRLLLKLYNLLPERKNLSINTNQKFI